MLKSMINLFLDLVCTYRYYTTEVFMLKVKFLLKTFAVHAFDRLRKAEKSNCNFYHKNIDLLRCYLYCRINRLSYT